ncbi:MAG: aminodeoxychorismate/anthranilate synthase component II [Prevotellaceae bacterium]|nr:aminodeoxychorismate/anthranilate synthase component II [Prevotella sp.]MDD7257683.1 aminodeoxychorismate/anthranilate synthase component II [Prevotellaceae bacterium]MDY6130724.1 aminodeoxychorismate/anthranilate synthase component II [Prevotella sp.]
MKETVSVVVIDNYDSFTYNLVHLIKALGAEVVVLKNDAFELWQLKAFDKIVLSPGPGVPSEAGLLMEVIRAYAGRKPILGVCLGHQAIGEVFGGKVVRLSQVFHGMKTTGFQRASDPIFKDCPRQLEMGRYHSWAVSKEGFPACLEITAESSDGLIMAMRHRHFDVHGIQFHPESILTPSGKKIMANWLIL